MSDYFRPMLAARESPASTPDFFERLKYPMLASPKLDGIRAIPRGAVLSRTGKPLPSRQVQELYRDLLPFDGELTEGDPTSGDVYHRTDSHVMSADKPGDITLHVFDYADESTLRMPFYERLELVESILTISKTLTIVPHKYIEDQDELLAYEAEQLALGYEGIMMRDPVAPYKNGRSTFNQGWLLKLKRFEDDEAVLVDILEGDNNNNELKSDELGFAKRSSMKAGKTPSGMAGRYMVRHKGEVIKVAPGHFNHADRREHLLNKEKYIGLTLKFRHFARGVKDLPRFPRAIGFRAQIDLV